MLIQPYDSEEFWSLQEPQLPKRSRLHHLPPAGIGTPFVESLTSYIARLAQSHAVLPSVLISREIAPCLKKIFPQGLSSRDLGALFQRSRAINGTGDIAIDFVQAIEKLTLRDNLRFLTLLNCVHILPSRGLFRTYKAWCPACYQNWHSLGQIIYEPLVWAIEKINLCPLHQNPLSLCCPHCQNQLPMLEWHSRPGYCSFCGKWLGSLSDPLTTSTFLPEEVERQCWVANTAGELITSAASVSSPIPRENVPKAVCAAINLVADGNITAFANCLGIPKNTVWMWYKGKSLPQLDVLLKICYCLEISLLDFLIPENLAVQPLHISVQKSSPQRSYNKRDSPKVFDSERVKEVLLATLAMSEEPPLTMKEVAQQLEYDRRTIFRHFPELSRAIAAKSQSYKKAIHLKEVEQSCQEVQQIALDLLNQGLHPSEDRVSKRMSKPGYFRYKLVRDSLYKVQHRTIIVDTKSE